MRPTPNLSNNADCLHRVFDPPEDNPVQKFSRSVLPRGKRVKDQTFGFDRIFDENASQDDVYEATTKGLLDSVLSGYNATVFAYGATGCGKTHTISGTAAHPGIIFLTMQDLFDKVAEMKEEKVTEISLSYLEIYNETIRDLLVPLTGNKGGLMLREDSHQAVSVAGLSSHHPQNVGEVMEMITRGNEARTMSPTEANATSSRSHAVIQINVAQKDRNASVEEPHTMATLSIIDLAGSERASATKNRGERLLEGANINKSLLALGSCINALCDARKRNHVPYRNSKLTRLLKFSLGGNCKTVMIVCVSPSSQHFDETQNTLRYANRAKNIQTKVTRNVYNVNRHVKDFLVKIDEQMALINELKAQQKDQEAVFFAKFRKQTEKRDGIAREGICRIRKAYEDSAAERQDRTTNMIKLRQIGRRIAMLSSWIAAFDTACDNIEAETPLQNLQAVRKTAQGIMIELESGRHHCQQKVTKNNWERSLNSALDTGLRQLKEIETGDVIDAETLSREVELLKANAEREALGAVADQDKLGDASTVQVLLQAHFGTIAAIEHLNSMNVDEAVEAATGILSKMLGSASKAVNYVVKPDGSIAPVEAFAPTKTGTPKRRKHAVNTSILEDSPFRQRLPVPAATAIPPYVTASPIRASPRRRIFLGSAKKGVQISVTPKKRRPVTKRAVRWRDDTEDGTLAEFEKTPQKFTPSSADENTTEIILPQISDLSASMVQLHTSSPGSSPIPPIPETDTTLSVPGKNNRFKAGFLSKKSEGSPLNNSMLPPQMTNLSSSDSDDTSPLRELNPGQPLNRRSITPMGPPKIKASDNATSSSASNSDTENQPTFTSKEDAIKIGSAVRRSSSVNHRQSSAHPMSISRTQRRRSPTAATSGSPPPDNMFAAGHVRRMVMGKPEKEDNWRVGVLSPRVQGVMSHSKGLSGNARRTTMGGLDGPARGHTRESSIGPASVGEKAAMRLSATPSRGEGGHAHRPSLATGKNMWR
jgi:kinesin family member 18/19